MELFYNSQQILSKILLTLNLSYTFPSSKSLIKSRICKLLEFTGKRRKEIIEARKFHFSFHLEFCYNKDYIAGWTELTTKPTRNQNSYGKLEPVVTCQLAGLN